MRSTIFACALAIWVVSAVSSSVSAEDEPDAAGKEFFEKKIRPVLVSKCYKCHAADSKEIKAGLLVDSREGIRKGGESGPAVVPGSAFGPSGAGHVRACYATEYGRIEEALRRIERFLARVRGKAA